RDEDEGGNEEAIVHQAERRDRETPRCDREERRDSLALDPLRPSRRERCDERADPGRGEEQSKALGTDREDSIGVEREKRARRTEKRREEVEQHRAEEDPARPEVREPLDERPDRKSTRLNSS